MPAPASSVGAAGCPRQSQSHSQTQTQEAQSSAPDCHQPQPQSSTSRSQLQSQLHVPGCSSGRASRSTTVPNGTSPQFQLQSLPSTTNEAPSKDPSSALQTQIHSQTVV